MQVAYLISIDGRIMELNLLSRQAGCDLNVTARKLLEECREEVVASEYRCAIYLANGNRLAFAGEEVMEGYDDDN